MKRISLVATILTTSISLGLPHAAWAVNPSTNSQSSPTSPQYYNPAIPGQDLYNYNNLGTLGTGLGMDPLYNPNLNGNLNLPYPGLIDPALRTVPNPNPAAYPDQYGRDRLSNSINPSYVPSNPGTPSQQRKWRLGVYSKDMDTGVRIYDVVNGGAAYRAGLEVNDQIIAINGFQVGYVKGQLYDCGTEFDRLADQNGWVTLLVQNNRDQKLVNVPVQLDSRLSTLTGSVALLNRQNLPPNAVVTVELREVLGNNGTPVTFASRRIENLNQYPIPFNMDFDPAQISPNGRYLVYASLSSNGRETHRTPQPIRVLDQNGQNRPVAIQLEPVQAGNTPYPNGQMGPNDQSAQVAQIVKWFNEYLGRNPSDRELVTWLQALGQGQSMSQVQLSLLANEQFFNRCDADKQVYITRMHELLIGRKPTQQEMAYWVARYDAQGGIRRDLAREFQGALGIH